jgi:hypothetical protein
MFQGDPTLYVLDDPPGEGTEVKIEHHERDDDPNGIRVLACAHSQSTPKTLPRLGKSVSNMLHQL